MTFRNIRSEQFIAGGQIILAICLVACTALLPHYFFSRDQGGVSNYGTRPQTTALYAIGFGIAGAGAALAAIALPKNTVRRATLRAGLLLLTALYGLVLFSTFQYKLNESLRLFHEYSAQALLVGGLILALYLRSVLRSDTMTRRIFMIFCGGVLIAMLTVLGYVHLLFTAELLCGGSFGYMLTRGVKLLTRPPRSQA